MPNKECSILNAQSNPPASEPSAPSAPDPHPYSSFAQFTRDQLLQISAWLDDQTYDKVIDLIKKQYGPEISQSALQRFYSKTAFKNLLAQTPETAEAAAQVLQFAATGRPNFTDASLRVLEQTAFQLSPTCHQQPADLDALNRITTIICHQKNTAVRERLAKVQETKCDLRREELALKRETIKTKQPKPAKLPCPPRRDQFSRDWDDTDSDLDTAPTTTPNPPRSSKPCYDLPPEVLEKNRIHAEKRARREIPLLDPELNPDFDCYTGQYLGPRDKTPADGISAPSPSDLPSAHTSHSSPESAESAEPPDPLLAAVDAYTVARAKEYWDWRRAIQNGGWAKHGHIYNTKLRHCPCGQPNPCPTHEDPKTFGPFPDHFWTVCPHEYKYADCLRDRGLTYRNPNECRPC